MFQHRGRVMRMATGGEHWKYRFPSGDLDGFDALADLALDLRWSWNHSTDKVWARLDPHLWQRTQNPWAVLQAVSRDRVQAALADGEFLSKIQELVQSQRRVLESPAWFQNTHGRRALSPVAYFSMEFMLSEALPIYAGGLGNVAGDQLKAASDLGVPVVGVGLLYQQGYFRQMIDRDGAQQALFPFNDPDQLPITPLRRANGEWLRLELDLPAHRIWIRAWRAQVGRVTLYLLDSNDLANFPAYRGITSELYGGGPELRLMQELVLGIGGWRLLSALDIHPEVCHLNEGHAALAILERSRDFMVATGRRFDAALAASRAGNLFTTHTPVDAGFDRFSPELVERCLGAYAREQLSIRVEDLLALGRRDPDDAQEPFNMAYLAVRGSGALNGVSRLHGQVSRRLFQPLFARWPEAEVPIGHVTNGVHMPTWDSPAADALWTQTGGKDRWLKPTEALEHDIRGVSEASLWSVRTAGRRHLVEYAREQFAMQLAVSGAPTELVERARQSLDPDALTLGFARRFATYKRPNLLLHDPERLLRLLSDPHRPVQLIVAGKAHPADAAGQALIRQLTAFTRRGEARGRVVFLADYDMRMTEHLVQGVDVWLNTPRRPWEASGTSGMKVLVNGGLNLSELDGWWAEAFVPEVGWALGDGREHGDDPSWDAIEAVALYDLLEGVVVPEFFDRDSNGMPAAWLARIRESMARLTPYFSANRAVREYTERYYLPAAERYRNRAAANGALGEDISGWQRLITEHWNAVRFGETTVLTREGQHVISVQAFLGDLDPDAVQVGLYADAVDDAGPVRQAMTREQALTGSAWLYRAEVPATRPAIDYTARLIPCHAALTTPLEASQILWQR
jgi:starch phosphorylase